MSREELSDLLGDTHAVFELTYLGSGFHLEVFRVYRRGESHECGQLRVYSDRWHLLRFDLPEHTDSPSPLTVEEDEDGESWSVPGWDSVGGFLSSFEMSVV